MPFLHSLFNKQRVVLCVILDGWIKLNAIMVAWMAPAKSVVA